MRIARVLLLALACVPSLPGPAAALGENEAQMRAFRAAYARKDWPAVLAHAEAIAKFAPKSTRAQYNLACALALNGRGDEAVRILDALATRGVWMNAAADEDLVSLKGRPDYQRVLGKFGALKQPLGRAFEAFRLAGQKDLVTEGVAHDPKSGHFFVSSVHRGKIVRIDREGRAKDFATGLDAVLGLATDGKRRVLYACTTAMREMAGYKPADEGRAAVVAFDIDRGREVKRLALPGPGPHNCNDLTVGTDGTLYVSDAAAKVITSAGPGDRELTALVPSGRLASPQGLALSADGRQLYVADYGQGVMRIDTRTGAVAALEGPESAALGGIDGLVRHGDELIAVQNGISPHRVLRLKMDGQRISGVEVLERSHPAFDEPTLGTLVGDTFFFIANSQWSAFDKEGRLRTDRMQDPVVLRINLR